MEYTCTRLRDGAACLTCLQDFQMLYKPTGIIVSQGVLLPLCIGRNRLLCEFINIFLKCSF